MAVVLVFMLSALWLGAEETPAAPGASEGEKLERQMAADIKAKNWNAVESRIAEGFQSVHPDGPRDRAGEIALLKKMNFGDFTQSNFKSTVVGDNIVVTFTMGRVAAPAGGVVKCFNPGGRIARAVRIAFERSITRSGIDDAISVARERLHTDGRVATTIVGKKGKSTNGRIVVASGIV